MHAGMLSGRGALLEIGQKMYRGSKCGNRGERDLLGKPGYLFGGPYKRPVMVHPVNWMRFRITMEMKSWACLCRVLDLVS